MPKLSKIIVLVVLGLTVLFVIFKLSGNDPETGNLGAAGENNFFAPMTISSSVSVASASSTTILSASVGRIYAVIVNDSPANIYLSLGGTATKGTGIRLNALGGSYEINAENSYQGAVSGIASSSGTTDYSLVTVTEK